MAQEGYKSCSGCGRLFKMPDEQQEYDTHDCNPVASYDHGYDDQAAANVPTRVGNVRIGDYVYDEYTGIEMTVTGILRSDAGTTLFGNDQQIPHLCGDTMVEVIK